MKKPITPTVHGIMDYAFSAIQFVVPALLGLNKKNVTTYAVLGSVFTGTNALTKTGVGLKPVLSFKTHQKADRVFLATLGLLTLDKAIRKDKRALAFHLTFLATTLAHYLLTDYTAREEKEKEVLDII